MHISSCKLLQHQVPIDLLRDAPQVSLGTFERLLADADTESLNADIIDVVRLVEDDDALLLHLPGHNAGHLGINQVLVAVDHDIGVLDHLPREEVGADPAVAAEGAEVGEGVDAGGHVGGEVTGGGGAVEGLEEVAERGGVRVWGGPVAHPRRGEAAAGGVDGVAGGGGGGLGVDAEVLAGGEAEGEEGAGGSGGEVGEEEAELGEGLLHLVDGAGAVDEAERAGRAGEGVGGDEGNERRRLAGARRHLEQRVAARVEGALQLAHVRVLLRVDRRVREVHRQALQVELHRGGEVGAGGPPEFGGEAESPAARAAAAAAVGRGGCAREVFVTMPCPCKGNTTMVG